MFTRPITKPACFALGLLALASAQAQVAAYRENFNGVTTNLDWIPLGDACLTASGNGLTNTGTYTRIQKCPSTMYTSAPTQADPVGAGALLLTPAKNNQTGAVLSNFTFDATQGLSLTYTTYTYGGSADGNARLGADGIVFILSDGTAPAPAVSSTSDLGGFGGSMGYSCDEGGGNSRNGHQGFPNAYLGIGTDEYGNFLNSGDNGPVGTNSGIYNTNYSGYASKLPSGYTASSFGSNTYSNNTGGILDTGTGPQFQPNRIGIRGAGNVTPAAYGYPSPSAQLHNVCMTSGLGIKDWHGQIIPGTEKIPNYNTWNNGYKVLPSSQPIAIETAKKLSAATPISYKLTISPKNNQGVSYLNFSFSYNGGTYQPVLTNMDITSKNPPLPDKLRFGFTAGTGGSNNVHEITCFAAAPIGSNSSASGNTLAGQVQIGSQIYLASYNANDWSGTVQAIPVTIDADENLSVSSAPNWDANCMLTGGLCASTELGAGTTNAAGTETPSPLPGSNTTGSARVLLTSASAAATGGGVSFQPGSLDTTEIAALGGTTAAATAVAWLRGNRSTEQFWGATPGTLRARAHVLGDIINSSPVWVGAPQAGAHPDAFNDFLYPGTAPETAFSAYVSSAAARQPVVYAGSNDGFVHGFRTGSVGDTTVPNDGQEVLGFMPSGQLQRYAAGIPNPLYAHSYVVDATPEGDDLFYGNAWHTWLVGGVGSAGQEIYALDVSSPGTFAESQATLIVKGDWTPANTGGASGSLSHLNCTVGTPAVKRLHNKQWAIIFGNGLPDAAGTATASQHCKQAAGTYTAGIYIGLIDSSSGNVTSFRWLDTGVGASSSSNGIAYISPVDVDGDSITDYVYAGDLQGNLWRFDLTDSNPGNWKVSTFGKPTPTPLFSAGSTQPITTAPIVAAVQTASSSPATPRMMVYFGTGQLTPPTTNGSAGYAAGTQTFYGIWDWDWAGTPWAGQFVSMTGTQNIAATGGLLIQTFSTPMANYRSLSTSTVCWAEHCASGMPQYGWKFNFPDKQEQVIYNPVAVAGAIVVSSAEPPLADPQACNLGQQTGWTMAFNPATGGGFTQGFFPDGNGNFGSGSNAVFGVRQNLVGSPVPLYYKGKTYITSQTVSGNPYITQIQPPANGQSTRTSWREIKN